MAKKASCWFVVSFYAGDLWKIGNRSAEKPAGFVRGTHGKAKAHTEAKYEDSKAGPNVSVRAVKCDRAKRLFDLKV